MFFILIYASTFSTLIPIIVGSRFARKSEHSIFLIKTLLAASLGFDLLSLVLSKAIENNLFVIHIYGLVEFLFLSLFFQRILKIRPRLARGAIAIYLSYYIVNSILFEPVTQFNALARSIEALIFIALSLKFLHKLFYQEDEVFIERLPFFWIAIGILSYFSAAFFTFLLSADILAESEINPYYSWGFHAIATIIKNLLIATGLWKIKAK